MYCNCIFEDVFFIYYNCIYRAKITLNIKELVIDVDVKINDLLPFCSKVSFMAVECQKWLCSCWFFQVSLQQRGPWSSLSETVEKLLVVKFSLNCIVVKIFLLNHSFKNKTVVMIIWGGQRANLLLLLEISGCCNCSSIGREQWLCVQFHNIIVLALLMLSSVYQEMLHSDFRRQFFAPVYWVFVLIKRICWTERCVTVVLKLFYKCLKSRWWSWLGTSWGCHGRSWST